MESIKKVDSRILAAVALFGVVGAGWFAYSLINKNSRSPESPSGPGEAEGPSRGSIKSEQEEGESPEKVLVRVLKGIKRTIQDDRMTYDSVKAIYEGQYELSRREFQLLVNEKRHERRRLIGDLRRYMEAISDWDEKLEDIHNSHLNAILAHFKVDKEGWMNMVTAMSTEHKEGWDKLILDCEKQEFDSVRNTDKPPVRLSVLCDIQKFKCKLLRENEAAFKEAAKDDQNALFLLMEKWVGDRIYEAFRVEEEDINHSI